MNTLEGVRVVLIRFLSDQAEPFAAGTLLNCTAGSFIFFDITSYSNLINWPNPWVVTFSQGQGVIRVF